ncbi:ATP-binding protein [Streptomyces sp. NPDC091377]|uniref:ATP-binding protein n=1 Tax=Streptomyces sp. NPDC091377 TaxID=3365995 RepID=UPI0038179BA2
MPDRQNPLKLGRTRLPGIPCPRDTSAVPQPGEVSPDIQAASIGRPAYSRNLPRIPESASKARSMVTTAVLTWGLKELVDPARLVVTELVANAANHARMDTILVTATLRAPDAVRISVVDRSRTMPQRRNAADDDEQGRGLELIDALSGGLWGVDALLWGKRVWADLEAPRGHRE